MTARSAVVGALVSVLVLGCGQEQPPSVSAPPDVVQTAAAPARTPIPPSVGQGAWDWRWVAPTVTATAEASVTATQALEQYIAPSPVATAVATPYSAPSATPAPTAIVRSSSQAPVREAIEASVWPEQYHDTLERVIACESSDDPSETGLAGERGLMQIHPVHAAGLVAELGYSWDAMYEAGPNLDVAYSVFLAQGPSAWSCW